MDTGQGGVECTAFQNTFDVLVIGITDPSTLALKLYTKKMITQNQLAEVLRGGVANSVNTQLMLAVQRKIEVDSEHFNVFCDILLQEPSFEHLAKRLKAAYDQLCESYIQSGHLMEHVPPVIARYAQYLRSVYARRSRPIEERKWHPISTKSFINLAMICKRKEKKAEMDEFTAATIRGNIDDIIDSKKPINLKDIGSLENGSRARCILVQGAPGIGKTMLAWQLCRKWGEKKLLQDYPIVVLLKMRDKSVQKAKQLGDLFTVQDPEMAKELCKEIGKNAGKSLLLVLEGYDELPLVLQQKSIFSDIIIGELLPEATVLITSRPSASKSLVEKCSSTKFQHIEVIGFTKEQIKLYVEDVVGEDEALLRDFNQYLSHYPHLHTMMYIPLNCAIVVEIYKLKRDSGAVPKTQTELYTELTVMLFRRYTTHTEDPADANISTPPSDPRLLDLSKLAYEGIKENRLIFQSMPSELHILGFTEAVPELYATQSSASYNFLHLSLQEYLAAYYVSNLSIMEQRKFIDASFEDQHLLIVLRFLAGLTKFHIQCSERNSLSDRVSSFMKGLVKTRTPADSLRSFHHSRTTFIETLHWIFEAQERKLLTIMLGYYKQDRDVSSQSLNPLDCYALGYCVVNSECTWRLKLQNCSINEDGMEMLAHALDGGHAKIEALDLHRNPIYCRGAAHLALALKGNEVLSELRLALCNIGSDGIVQLCEALTDIPTLRVLNLSGNTVDLLGAKKLDHDTCIDLPTTAMILKKHRLYELNVGYCMINADAALELAEALCCDPVLQYLSLQGNPIEQIGAGALANMLRHNLHLQTLSLTGCVSIGEAGTESLVEALKDKLVSLKHLQLPEQYSQTGKKNTVYSTMKCRIEWCSDLSTTKVMNRRGYIDQHEVNVIASALRWNTILSELRLEQCAINAKGMTDIAQALCGIPTLKVINLEGNQLNYVAARQLGIALHGSTTLTELTLADCSIEARSVSKLVDAIGDIPTLKIFDLSCNAVGSEGVKHLVLLLETSKSLIELNLSKCKIDASATCSLAEALCCDVKLKVLWLQDNCLGERGAAELASMLRRNRNLSSLWLESCDSIHLAGANKLVQSLEFNKTLQCLSLPRKFESSLRKTEVYANVKDRILFSFL